jgi:cation diffusion facilitator family transporter
LIDQDGRTLPTLETPRRKPAPAIVSPAQAARLTRGVTALSVGMALSLVLIKLAGWRSSGSVAMLASMADSGLDVVAALATFAAVRYAATPPDEEHRYGHGKAEAFSSLLQATLVFTSAALIGWQATMRLIAPAAVKTGAESLLIMVVATAATAVLVWAQSWVLSRTRSLAVSGDRAHYIADLGSNLAALVGIALATFLHWERADALAGVFVAAWLVWGALGVLKDSSDSLMDRELDEADRSAITALVLADPAIPHMHALRTRASGPVIHIQLHAEIAAHTTLVEAQDILVRAEQRVHTKFPGADILILPDPLGFNARHGHALSKDDGAQNDGANGEPIDPRPLRS